MSKRVILFFAAGWALAIILPPQKVIGFIRPKSA